MRWTPGHTIGNALWISGGQWAGKSTVSELLADKYGLVHYIHDARSMRGHEDRKFAEAVRRGDAAPDTDWEAYWVTGSPHDAASTALKSFPDAFRWALDDLRSLYTPRPVLAEGWALRPELVAGVVEDLGRMVVLVPTDAWRLRQAATIPRAGAVSARVSDPQRAQRNRIERDRLVAEDAVRSARRLGVKVIEVDGSRGVEEISEEISTYFRAYLPPR